ncbi:ABC multidrug transporter [Erysiphe necator]|nr:ABC multidrug transporter [Erysiphe necator]
METTQEKIWRENPSGFSRTHGRGIDVAASEAEFSDLERRLSSPSWISHTAASVRTSISEDTENGYSGNTTISPHFNLEETLRGTKLVAEKSGIRPKHIGVVWENLSVYGTSGQNNYVKTFIDAITSFFNIYATAKSIFGLGYKAEEAEILKSFRGVAKPGEMVLVLGRPGSGCTTFLKVITNQRSGFTRINGEVLYGPFSSKTFAARYRGETVYNQEDDIHIPTLTVGQTLGFAIDLKTPGKRPAGISKAKFKEEVIATLLKMFNIEHTKNTMVGDNFIRGVSGGERKRVSIAEMLTTSATVCAWDNSTRGLDASTALEYIKSLRIMTNICKTTTFVSLYQASEKIYKQFDKVLVIDSGQEVFFGPAQEARTYFESLGFKEKPRMTTPDFLTGCTDEFEREYTDLYLRENLPHTPDTLSAAFNQSTFAQDLDFEIAQYKQQLEEDVKTYTNFQIAVKDSKMRGTSENSVYCAPFYLQVLTLLRRSFLVKWQDKFTLAVSWITSIVIAVVLGSVWLNLPTTSASAFRRGGLLFIALLFPMFQAFTELAVTMMGRPVVNKHKAFAFYRPSALWLAHLIVDMAFSAAKILVFCIIVYFMTGLVLEAGAFFTFYGTILIAYLAISLFFRSIGFMCPDFDYAIKFTVTFIMLFIITTGYLIQNQSQHIWFKWIYYVNAIGLAFTTIMINEFRRLILTCSSESLVPSGPGYNNIKNQVCTLPGSIPGLTEVYGSDYLRQGYSYKSEDIWKIFGLLILITIVFLISYLILGEAITWGAGGNTARVFQKPNRERDKLNMALKEKREKRRMTKSDVANENDINIETNAILTWEDLCYDVPTPSGKLRLLNNIFGYVEPGSLTALMGASGAGKTTLLDVIAARKTVGVISGEILVDGLKPGGSFQRQTSYAEQQDLCEPTQTVREALRFSADLRQPFDTPQCEKYAYVEEILSLLEMEDIADAIIGEPNTGLSVEQRKRVTIGIELAAKPELLLFLDEPTSGLDSQSAFNIVRFLRKLARAGQAILCTIHQPNAALFENFDRLLLLQRGGRTAYFGEIGIDASVLRMYFEKNGAICPSDANVAEWMLEVMDPSRNGGKDWSEIWSKSPELACVKENISQIKSRRLQAAEKSFKIEEKEFATPLYHQLKVVIARTNLSYWRSSNYGFTRLFNHAIIGLVNGLAYMNLDTSQQSLQYRIFLIFQVSVLPFLILNQVEIKYSISRMIYYREASAKMYSQFAFALSLVVAEIPYSLLCVLAFFLPLYFIPGLSKTPSSAGYQFAIVMVTEFFSVSLGQLLAALTPSPFISSLLDPFIMIAFALFCGVTIPKLQIPKYWRWLHELDPITRLVGGMIVTELHELPVNCHTSELRSFNAPADQNCGEYMEKYFQDGGVGYLVDNMTQLCQYCHYRVGDQFYNGLGLQYNNRWRDLGIFLAMVGSNLILLFIASRFLNFNRR